MRLRKAPGRSFGRAASNSPTTIVFIKNVTKEPQEFMLNVAYLGGRWGSKVKTLAPGQTFALDIRKLRDAREAGAEGGAIPPTITSGHVAWGLRGNRGKALIGRAQTVDFSNGLASTYECQCLCDWSWGSEARLLPGSVSGFPGDITSFDAQSRYNNCFGQNMGWYSITASDITYSSDNSSVATFAHPLTATAVAEGSTYLRASWTEYYHQQFSDWECSNEAATAACSAFCEVSACQKPTEETTESDGWKTPLQPTLHHWIQRLKPLGPQFNQFAGRIVTEQDPGVGGEDKCWFPGSERDPFTKVTDGNWTVDNSNAWGPDKIGWSHEAVVYYRAQRRVPCNTKFKQRMVINCPGASPVEYATKDIGAGIETIKISSSRDGKTATRDYSTP